MEPYELILKPTTIFLPLRKIQKSQILNFVNLPTFSARSAMPIAATS